MIKPKEYEKWYKQNKNDIDKYDKLEEELKILRLKLDFF